MPAAPTEQTLFCGTTNGWLIHIDLRTGRYEKKGSHSDCVNGACLVPSSTIVATGGDDKMIRLTDLRMANANRPVGVHQLKSVVFSLCADEEALYAGGEEGELSVFDYSASANPLRPCGGQGDMGGSHFTAEQQAALTAAMASARNLRPAGAFR